MIGIIYLSEVERKGNLRMTISFLTFIEKAGLDGVVKIVRHRAEVDVVERFLKILKALAVTMFCKAPMFSKAQTFCAEFGAMGSTRAMFLGIWRVVDRRRGTEVPRSRLTKICTLEDRFLLKIRMKPPNERVPAWVYTLEPTHVLAEYSGRPCYRLGGGTRAWVQRILDKPVLSLRESLKAKTLLKPFKGYSAARLSFQELQRLAKDPYANKDWQDALTVDGVYAIADRGTGQLYVGSAYGEGGMLGRWLTYAKTGHGGNKELKKLNPDFFQFTVLRPMPGCCQTRSSGSRE